MKKWLAVVLPIVIVGCGGDAFVEVGANDGALLAGTLGDIGMRVTRIEIPDAGDYVTIWEGAQPVLIAIQTTDFVSITNGYVDIAPGSYANVRVTVDSVWYANDSSVVLIYTPYTFTATAFSPIVISENQELRLAVYLNSSSWFSIDSLKIREGHEAFEGAGLRISY
jgi:hypothetical protein